MDFINSLQAKAQAALDKTGFDVKLPQVSGKQPAQAQQPHGAPSGQGGPPYGRTSTDVPDGRSTTRPFIVDTLQHQLRALHNQYAPQGPPDVRHIQVLITNSKGVSLDFEGVGRDSKAQSKDFYLWSQDQEEDIKDVTDRLSYMTFVHGNLASVLSEKLDASRAPLKKLRDAQAQLSPRLAQRNLIMNEINGLQNNPKAAKAAGADARLQHLQQQLRKMMTDDQLLEKDVAEVRRLAVRESEQQKWEAYREYASKLLLACEAAQLVIQQLPEAAPTSSSPYNGALATAGARSALEGAIDNWKPGMTTLPGGVTGGVGSAGVDTRSFGESHASELSRVNSFSGMAHTESPQPLTSATAGAATAAAGTLGYSASSPAPVVAAPPAASSTSNIGGVVNPALLNNNPAVLPEPVVSSATATSPAYQEPTSTISPPSAISNVATDGHSTATSSAAPSAPTVAETGIPLTAGTDGPGPSSGSLSRDTKIPVDDSPPYSFAPPGAGATGPQSAEDEKKRLEREEREKLLSAATAASGSGVGVGQGAVGAATTTEQYPSAEDEKKRLEREEREKLLGTSSSTNYQDGPGPNPDQKDLTGPPTGPPPDYS